MQGFTNRISIFTLILVFQSTINILLQSTKVRHKVFVWTYVLSKPVVIQKKATPRLRKIELLRATNNFTKYKTR